MNMHRFYCCPITNGKLPLATQQGHYMTRVMRLILHDNVELFDGKGTLAQATIVSVAGDKVIVEVNDLQSFDRPESGRIIMAASVAKGDRFDWLISKCTELGVDRICPVIFQRTVKQPGNPKIVQRYNKLAVAAAGQCGRLFLPQIDTPLKLPDALELLQKAYPRAKTLFGGLTENAEPLIKMVPIDNDVIAFVGPEGGFTEQENELLINHQALEIKLTATTLRVETAAITFAALLAAIRDGEQYTHS